DLEMTEFEFDGYKSKYLDLWTDRSKNPENGKESILNDVDFELELIHRDEINVGYILSLLANLKDSNLKGEKLEQKKKEIREILSGDAKLRSKKELIEKFIEESLPLITDADLVQEAFSDFWNEEKRMAFERIADEEHLNKEKFEETLNEYLFTQKTPKLRQTLQLLEIKPKLSERSNIGK